MIGRRIGAVVAAVALIVGALFVRDALDDDAAAGEEDEAPPAAGELVCITELADVCRALAGTRPDLAITVEDAGTTLDQLAAIEDAEDTPLWLTIDPFPAMVDELRRSAGQDPIAGDTTPVGVSRLALALPGAPQAETLAAACADDPLWRCVGEQAGDEWVEIGGEARWATVDPSVGDVDASAMALASLANAVSGYFGDTDVSLSRWQTDPSFTPWLQSLARAVPTASLSAGTPLATMTTRESAVDVAATTDGEVAASATGDAVAILYPEPSMSAVAVLAVPSGQSAPDDLAGDLATELAGSGWDPAAATDTSPVSAGVMLALRTLWEETT